MPLLCELSRDAGNYLVVAKSNFRLLGSVAAPPSLCQGKDRWHRHPTPPPRVLAVAVHHHVVNTYVPLTTEWGHFQEAGR